MTTKTDSCRPTSQELSLFLSRYCSWLLGCGATCIRLEKNVTRMAQAYGKETDMTIMPRHVHISVWEKGAADSVTSIASMHHCPTSFNMNSRLSELSWEVADCKISFDEAVSRFNRIISDDQQNRWAVLLLVALANASFCRLFGGDAAAMAIVAAATIAGYYIKQLLLSRGLDLRIVFIACAFVSAVLGATGRLFAIGTTPSVALGTSVLYLVPGIPFLNSFSDMLCRHYICAICRFADALVLTACLSAGLCCAMLLMDAGMF